MQSVILAGGLGTRLRPYTNKIPKPMVEVLGKPFLEYKIHQMIEAGAEDIVLCVGYLAQPIVDYFGNGARLGARIRYSFEGDNLLGTIGALKNAEKLLDESFLFTYGDSYLPLDYGQAMSAFISSKKLAMMVVYENHDRFGRSDIEVREHLVTIYDKHRKTPGMIWINYGVLFFQKASLDLIPAGRAVEEEEFYQKLIERKELWAYETTNRFYEIGTPDSLEEFRELVSKRNFLEGQEK
jgi:NDP-sugar pyrophosphorylase family protein